MLEKIKRIVRQNASFATYRLVHGFAYFSEIIIFSFAFLTRFVRLDYPKTHIFDEVYHAFTASEMFKGNQASWEWWNTPPSGFAYEWTHPPLAKEFMVLAINFFGNNSFAWRFFSALSGFGIIVLVYFIALELFKSRKVAILSSLVASLDGLLLTMSRIAMNDSFFIFFALLAILFFLKDRKLLMGIFLGLSIASKWTGFFAVGIIAALFIIRSLRESKRFKVSKFLIFLFVFPVLIYLLSYLPFFLQKHTPPGTNYSNYQSFVELQKQMFWYHTNLKATHTYQSKPIDWIFNLRPVWLYVDYQKGSVANIYTLSNPAISWFGIFAIIFSIFNFIKKKSFPFFVVLICYFGFFVPWIFSPRIMFNYHYLPSMSFLTIASGFVLNEFLKDRFGKVFSISFLILIFSLFIYFYPLWTGIHVPKELSDSYLWFKSWK